MVTSTTVARPYAKAAFDAAKDAGTIDKWSAFLGVVGYAAADSAVIDLLTDPRVSPDDLFELFKGIAGKHLFTEAENFLKLVANKQRLGVLDEVSVLFEEYKLAQEKILPVNITTAFAMSDDQRAKFEAALSKRLNFKIDLTVDVNELLLGGAIVRADDLVIDGSIKTHLDSLYHQLCME